MSANTSARASLYEIARFLRRVQFCAIALGIFWLVWLLAPILTPFVVGAMLGWLGDPLVDRLVRRGRSRGSAVLLVFALMCLILVLGVLLLVPTLQEQIVALLQSLPQYRDWLMETAIPWVERHANVNIRQWLDGDRVSVWVREHWQQAGGIAAAALGYLSRSGVAMLVWAANLVLIPIVTYFFLRDWDVFVERIAALIPRAHLPTVTRLAKESDEVLGGFLRGQFLVMIAMGVFYAVGLSLVGLDVGVLIGVVAGVFTFVPYLGPAVVVIFGSIAALMEFGDWQHLLGVGIVWGVGQLLESYALTPKLVGERIGLHPLAVVFAVMAGGVLFGFAGMLLALPMAAVANVLMHFAVEQYRASKVYVGESPVILMPPDPPQGVAAEGLILPPQPKQP